MQNFVLVERDARKLGEAAFEVVDAGLVSMLGDILSMRFEALAYCQGCRMCSRRRTWDGKEAKQALHRYSSVAIAEVGVMGVVIRLE